MVQAPAIDVLVAVAAAVAVVPVCPPAGETLRTSNLRPAEPDDTRSLSEAAVTVQWAGTTDRSYSITPRSTAPLPPERRSSSRCRTSWPGRSRLRLGKVVRPVGRSTFPTRAARPGEACATGCRDSRSVANVLKIIPGPSLGRPGSGWAVTWPLTTTSTDVRNASSEASRSTLTSRATDESACTPDRVVPHALRSSSWTSRRIDGSVLVLSASHRHNPPTAAERRRKLADPLPATCDVRAPLTVGKLWCEPERGCARKDRKE